MFALQEYESFTALGNKNRFLEVSGLVFSVPGRVRPVVSVASLAVREGETLFILGRNGAGKTSLLHLLGGLIPPLAGKIMFRGRELPPVGQQLLPGFSFAALVPQEPAWNPFFLVREEAARMLRSYPEPVRKRKERFLVRECRLRSVWDARLGSLSGGERKRLTTGLALLRDCPVLLMDEPFANLDEENRDWLRDMLLEMKSDAGITCILVHHHARDLEFLADRVAVMKNGHILETIEAGPGHTFNPGKARSARLMGWKNIHPLPTPPGFGNGDPNRNAFWHIPPWEISTASRQGLPMDGLFSCRHHWMEEGRPWYIWERDDGLRLVSCGQSSPGPEVRLYAQPESLRFLKP